MNNYTQKYETFYFGMYRDIHIPIAISKEKGLVKEYMEVHRNVRPKDYSIQEHRMTDGEVMLDFEYSIIENYENWYIPSVDIEMIEVNKYKIEDIIKDTIHNLKLILLYTQDIKKISENDRSTITKSMQIINSFKNKKKVWNKIVDNYKLSEVLFMDIEDYWRNRCMYIDMKESRQRWDFMITDKGGDKTEE